jgi:hypothetical protein
MNKFFPMAASCLFAGLVVTGCTSEPAEADADGDGTITAEEMAEASKNAVRPRAGQYRSTTTLLDAEIPGAPDNMVDIMKTQIDGQSYEYCLTQEQVDKGFEEMARGSQEGDCDFTKFVIDGGNIDAAMTCSVAGQGEMTIAMDGEGSETSMDMTMTMTGERPGMGAMKMVMKTAHERIGDCSE